MASDKGERINLVGKIVIAGVATWQSLKINYSSECYYLQNIP
jgi:hypothetical protein